MSRAEIVSALFKNLFDTLFDLRQLRGGVLLNLFGNARPRAVRNIQIEFRQAVFVEDDIIAAQKLDVEIFAVERIERTLQPRRKFLQRFVDDANARRGNALEIFASRFDIVQQLRANFFVGDGAAVFGACAENFRAVRPRAHYFDGALQSLRDVVFEFACQLAGIFFVASVIPIFG